MTRYAWAAMSWRLNDYSEMNMAIRAGLWCALGITLVVAAGCGESADNSDEGGQKTSGGTPSGGGDVSAGHPTADGRIFADLFAGTTLGGIEVVSVETQPYMRPFTCDILPASDTGTYFAGGALIGSTLLADPNACFH